MWYNIGNSPGDSISGLTPTLWVGCLLLRKASSMERVIAYVDGYNLYYGLREKGWKRFYWLNIKAMVGHFLRPGQKLVATKYFTTIVNYPEAKRRRQSSFLEALQTLSDFQIYYGHFLADSVSCRECGHTYRTYHEKMTDVNISVEMMSDAFQDQFDVAFLVSADSDLVGPVKAVQRLFAMCCAVHRSGDDSSMSVVRSPLLRLRPLTMLEACSGQPRAEGTHRGGDWPGRLGA